MSNPIVTMNAVSKCVEPLTEIVNTIVAIKRENAITERLELELDFKERLAEKELYYKLQELELEREKNNQEFSLKAQKLIHEINMAIQEQLLKVQNLELKRENRDLALKPLYELDQQFNTLIYSYTKKIESNPLALELHNILQQFLKSKENVALKIAEEIIKYND